MYLLSFLPIALQLLLVIHVVKTGQDRFWIWLLVFLPVAGGLAYLIVVVLPELGQSHQARSVASGLSRAVNPTKRLKELERTLSLSNTVANKLALADECLDCGMAERAEELYTACLAGLFKGDRNIALKRARALAVLERWAEACEALEAQNAAAPLERVEDQLLLLLCGGKAGREATAVNQDLARLFAGSRNLEVGYHLAASHADLGNREAARKTVDEMTALLDQHRQFRSTMGKHWLTSAKKLL